MLEKLVKIRQEAMEQILSASSADSLNDLRVRYLGKKGMLTEVLKGMKDERLADQGPPKPKETCRKKALHIM